MAPSPKCCCRSFDYVGADAPQFDEFQIGTREVDAEGWEDDPDLSECCSQRLHCRVRVDVPPFRRSHEQDAR